MAWRWTTHPTPVGDILIVTAEDAIVRLGPTHGPAHWAVERLAVSENVPLRAELSDLAETAAAQLDEYFAGARRQFDLPLHWKRVHGFAAAALHAVCEIGYGQTASYGEIAVLTGHPRAARAVGTACRHTPFSIVVPVHRVVRSDGSVGQYGAHPEAKRYLLDLERVWSS